MPKLKTNKGIAKRFRKTKKKKLMYHHAFARHLMTGKSSKRKRRLRKASKLSKTEYRRYASLIQN